MEQRKLENILYEFTNSRKRGATIGIIYRTWHLFIRATCFVCVIYILHVYHTNVFIMLHEFFVNIFGTKSYVEIFGNHERFCGMWFWGDSVFSFLATWGSNGLTYWLTCVWWRQPAHTHAYIKTCFRNRKNFQSMFVCI